jgi:hypothetical protein
MSEAERLRAALVQIRRLTLERLDRDPRSEQIRQLADQALRGQR